MTEGEQLLRAVLEEPGDDTVRLVMADWLDENGEPERAEFVRAMVEVEKCRPDCGLGKVCRGVPDVFPGVVTCAGVRDLATTLFDVNLCRWEYGRVIPDCAYRLPWRGVEDTARVMAIYRRGFVSEVRLPAASFTEDVARALFSRHPIERVVLSDVVVVAMGPNLFATALQRGAMAYYPNGDQHIPQKTYATAEECRRDLDRSLVEWGRSLVEPPLKPLETEKDKSVSEQISS